MVSRVARPRPRLVAPPAQNVVALKASPPQAPVVPEAKKAPEPKPETLAEQIRRLQSEAKALARGHIDALKDALLEVERLAAEIGEGGDVYPNGVRELARRFASETDTKVQALMAIVARS
ncbi:MAG: hypothetical protein V4597_11960 [Pseudomonadota bacterium]